MRGEYLTGCATGWKNTELPPRARRIPGFCRQVAGAKRTTSACAENTCRLGQKLSWLGNYLRVRGEYGFRTKAEAEAWELPPRARRIHTIAEWAASDNGTTSACAENTFAPLRDLSPARNYLRVRGEYRSAAVSSWAGWELPPRARRIHNPPCPVILITRTTSACAENTGFERVELGPHWNYLRVRGEYVTCVVPPLKLKELPPRARRIPTFHGGYSREDGTTSACAENT